MGFILSAARGESTKLRQGFQAAEVSSSMVYGRGPPSEVSEPSRPSPSCGSKLCHGIRRLQHLLHLRRLHQLPASTGAWARETPASSDVQEYGSCEGGRGESCGTRNGRNLDGVPGRRTEPRQHAAAQVRSLKPQQPGEEGKSSVRRERERRSRECAWPAFSTNARLKSSGF